MFFHYTFRGPLDHAWPASFPVLSQVSKYGYLGVNVFFILSGFVILLTAYEKNAMSFCMARMVRLYPAYWISVTLTTIAILLAGSAHHRVTFSQYLTNLTMLQNFLGVGDISGVYWTLAVELKFYFLIFLVLMMRQVHRIGALLGAWLLASVVLSFLPPHGIARFFLFPEWSSYFIAGAMLFLIHREGPSVYKVLVVLACYGLSVVHAVVLPAASSPGSHLEVSPAVVVALLTTFYCIFLLIALRRHSIGSPKPLYVLGLLTYPLYLLHQDIGYVLLRMAPGANRYLLLCTVIAAVIALAWLVQVGPERWLASRFKRVLNKVGQRSAQRADAADISAPAASSVATLPLAVPVGTTTPVAVHVAHTIQTNQ